MQRILLIITLGVFLGCSADEIPDPFSVSNLEFEYVPLEIGNERLFIVDSIIFDQFNGNYISDTSTFFLREVLAEVVEIDNRSMTATDLYKSESTSGPWTFYKRQYEWIDLNAYHRMDNNLELTLFAFPPRLGKSWAPASLINANVGIPIGPNYVNVYNKWSEAYMIDFLDSLEVNDYWVDSIYMVELVKSESLVDIRFEQHFYAKHIGLVDRRVKMLDTQDPAVNIDEFEDFAQAGYKLFQSRIIQ